MVQQGSSHSFRAPSLTERMASSAGAFLPARARRALRGIFNAILARTGGEFVCTLPQGERLRVLPQHRHIAYNLEEYTEFRASVQPGDVVLDIGANLGAYTLLFGVWTGSGGRVYAFEPAPASYAGLKAHVELNGLSNRITTLQQAVTSTDGAADFIVDGSQGANRLTSDRAETGATVVRVVATTIDAFCRQAGTTPQVIKIDAEGAELDVLRGGRATIRAAGAGLRLYVEMHPHLWAAFRTSRAEIEAELDSQGLTPERLDGQPDVWGIEGVCLRLRPCAS